VGSKVWSTHLAARSRWRSRREAWQSARSRPPPRRAPSSSTTTTKPRTTTTNKQTNKQGLQLKRHIDATLGSGDLAAAVRLPPGEDLNEWLAVNTVDFYNAVSVLHGTLAEFCTERGCEVMCAGSKVCCLVVVFVCWGWFVVLFGVRRWCSGCFVVVVVVVVLSLCCCAFLNLFGR
jgi:hypothetical protein